ncbi:MAG: MMPL family transporter [Gammaproteobacteria bacterium]|nr:MMPL family transporter [Gammaproteobacteria bacterium]
MKQARFYRFGKILYKLRYYVLLICIISVALCIPLIPKAVSHFSETGFIDPGSQSAITNTLLKEKIPFRQNQFVIMYESRQSFTKNPKLFQEIRNSLHQLKTNRFAAKIIYPDDNEKQVSKDKRTAYAVVFIKGNHDLTDQELEKLRASIMRPAHLRMRLGGEPFFLNDMKKQTEKDLIKAEYIATPVAVITLLLVFGSVVAALVPMILDGICAVFILSLLYLLGNYLSLSVFTLNIALLLGLCLSLDYALFIINRFREELKIEPSIPEALAITLATAGKAVFFSGLAVFISLSALLLFPINVLFSVGVGGLIAVGVAVFVSVVVLPALLAILKANINLFSIQFFKPNPKPNSSIWWWIVNKVVAKPWLYFIGILATLLILGSPFLLVDFGISDYRILPKKIESRKVFDVFKSKFTEGELTPITVIAEPTRGKILTKTNLDYLYHWVQKMRHDPRVARVDSIVSTTPLLKNTEYQMLYTKGRAQLPDSGKQLLTLTTNDEFSVVNIVSKTGSDSSETRSLVESIRDTKVRGLNLQVTGAPANTVDVLHRIGEIFPYAFLWVISLTYIILLLLFHSIFLPIKAIVVNILSLFASYGILVFIIQEGHFAQWLNFEAQGVIDISLLIIIFCALFGFSMDYEVFLLSRIKERYEQTGDSVESICYGIVHSSKIITSAAIIVILICFSFISADILLVKAFGLGIAIAIFVDAFLIRTIMVPAFMTILGKWNWYLPKWLSYLLPKLSFNPDENHQP